MLNNENVLNLLKDHRSIRKFKKIDIEEKIKEKLEQAFCLSPTSRGLQASSLIEIRNQSLKDEIAKISGQQYIKDIPLLYIFLTDYNIIHSLSDNKIYKKQMIDGAIDSVIASQSMFLVAKENGLDGFYIGSIHKDTKKICELLNLPKYVVPVIGLGLGYADQNQMKKPRMDKKLRIFKDKYIKCDEYEKLLAEYDDQIESYIDLRDNVKHGKFTVKVKNSGFSEYNMEFDEFE